MNPVIAAAFVLSVVAVIAAVALDRYLTRRWYDNNHLPETWHPQP